LSEVTDVRKLEIFKKKQAAKPTLEEFESILKDCATCPSKALAVLAAAALQEIYLSPDFDEELRLAVIQSDAFTMVSKYLFDTLNEVSGHRYKAKQEMSLYEKHMANKCPDCPPEDSNAS
jgi:hypothetical protein